MEKEIGYVHSSIYRMLLCCCFVCASYFDFRQFFFNGVRPASSLGLLVLGLGLPYAKGLKQQDGGTIRKGTLIIDAYWYASTSEI